MHDLSHTAWVNSRWN